MGLWEVRADALDGSRSVPARGRDDKRWGELEGVPEVPRSVWGDGSGHTPLTVVIVSGRAYIAKFIKLYTFDM